VEFLYEISKYLLLKKLSAFGLLIAAFQCLDEQPVARGQHVARDTVLFYLRNILGLKKSLLTISLEKSRVYVETILKSYELFIY
jgi:hypothetical protein